MDGRSSGTPSPPPDTLIHIIINPAAGHGNAPAFVEKHVVPLLRHLRIPHQLHQTKGVRDAGRIGRELLDTNIGDGRISVAIAGGDGTAHEMIEGILEESRKRKRSSLGKWELAILPLGTANALFSSLFLPGGSSSSTLAQDVSAFLQSTSTPDTVIYQLSSFLASLSSISPSRRLPITLTTILDPSGEPSMVDSDPIPSHIVLSTALHAAILHSSEALRASYPGLDRFKKAAEQNLGVAFQARVQLLPTRDGRILQYSPKAQAWSKPFTTGPGDSDDLVLEGPFSYFLSTTTTPRLEPTFVIAPLLSRLPPSPADPPSMDVVILRPLRDPSIRALSDSAEGSIPWQERVGQVFSYAYKDGAHVDLTYVDTAEGGREPSAIEMRGSGGVVVESFRCGGFRWTPTDPEHEPSHIVCADGSLHTIPRGGRAHVEVMDTGTDASHHGFYVWG